MDSKVPGSIPSKTDIFIKKKKRYSRDLNTGPLVPKSAMVAPRPQIDEKCMENQKIFGWALSNPKFTHYLIMKYETFSSKICGILEIILSLSFHPCSSILVWKLMVWMSWEMPKPPPMGNRVKGDCLQTVYDTHLAPVLCEPYVTRSLAQN